MSRYTGRRLVLASGLAAFALAVSACGSTSTTGATSAPASSAPAAAPSAPASPAAEGAVKLVAVNSAQLGPIVTDSAGFTLYRFDKDTNKPSATNCTGACAAKWPPVTAKDKVNVTGVGSALVGSVTRPDGTLQVTLNGWPLYRFAGDTAAGQTNGQGVGGTWFASTPEGKKASAQQSSSNSSGYPSGY